MSEMGDLLRTLLSQMERAETGYDMYGEAWNPMDFLLVVREFLDKALLLYSPEERQEEPPRHDEQDLADRWG